MSQKPASPRLQINARLVKERDRARARELRKLMFYGAAIVVPLLVYVWQRVDFLRVSYEVEGLKKERQQLQDQNKQLGVERSFLLSPDRIERMARKDLGLVDPQPSDVRRVAVIDGHIKAAPTQSAGAPAGRAPEGPAAPRGGGKTVTKIEAGVGVLPAAGVAILKRHEPAEAP